MSDFAKAQELLASYNRVKWNLFPDEIKHILTNELIEFRNLLVTDGGVMSARGEYQKTVDKIEKKLLELPHKTTENDKKHKADNLYLKLKFVDK